MKPMMHLAAVFAAITFIALPTARAADHTRESCTAWTYCHCNPGPLPPGTGDPVPCHRLVLA